MVSLRISRRAALARAASVAVLCLHERALAQAGSGKPIRIIVPFVSG